MLRIRSRRARGDVRLVVGVFLAGLMALAGSPPFAGTAAAQAPLSSPEAFPNELRTHAERTAETLLKNGCKVVSEADVLCIATSVETGPLTARWSSPRSRGEKP